MTLSIKDDHSTPDGAKAAAQQAIAENDDIILGPLFSPNVRAVGEIAQAANKPVIAFSTDTSTGAPGVYLLSFLVENYVDRIVDYAASQGKKSFAALIPNNDYGRVASAEFQQIAAQRGLRVVEIENYTPQTLSTAVGKIAAFGSQIDALFIPEQAEAMPADGAGARGGRAQFAEGADPRHRTLERCPRARPARRCKAPGSQRRRTAASRLSRSAIAPNSAATRHASRLSAMMRSRSSSRWPSAAEPTVSPKMC